MRIGKNTCQWLTLGSTDRCSRRCMGEYCGVHLNRLRKSVGTKPCKKCGKGVSNRYSLCAGCPEEMYTRRGPNGALNNAAREGHPERMQLAKDWGATNYNDALSNAALGGHLECMQLAKDWGATNYNDALSNAALGGHLECMQLAKNWADLQPGTAAAA